MDIERQRPLLAAALDELDQLLNEPEPPAGTPERAERDARRHELTVKTRTDLDQVQHHDLIGRLITAARALRQGEALGLTDLDRTRATYAGLRRELFRFRYGYEPQLGLEGRHDLPLYDLWRVENANARLASYARRHPEIPIKPGLDDPRLVELDPDMLRTVVDKAHALATNVASTPPHLVEAAIYDLRLAVTSPPEEQHRARTDMKPGGITALAKSLLGGGPERQGR